MCIVLKQREPATAKMMNRLTTVPSPNWFLPYLFLAAILEKYRWGFLFGALVVVGLIHLRECSAKCDLNCYNVGYIILEIYCKIYISVVDCCIIVY